MADNDFEANLNKFVDFSNEIDTKINKPDTACSKALSTFNKALVKKKKSTGNLDSFKEMFLNFINKYKDDLSHDIYFGTKFHNDWLKIDKILDYPFDNDNPNKYPCKGIVLYYNDIPKYNSICFPLTEIHSRVIKIGRDVERGIKYVYEFYLYMFSTIYVLIEDEEYKKAIENNINLILLKYNKYIGKDKTGFGDLNITTISNYIASGLKYVKVEIDPKHIENGINNIFSDKTISTRQAIYKEIIDEKNAPKEGANLAQHYLGVISNIVNKPENSETINGIITTTQDVVTEYKEPLMNGATECIGNVIDNITTKPEID